MHIQISNLDQKITKDELINLFQQHGPVAAAEIITDAFTGQPRGLATIEMEREDDAQNAINQLDKTTLNEHTISVKPAELELPKGSYRISSMQNQHGYQRVMGQQRKRGAKRR